MRKVTDPDHLRRSLPNSLPDAEDLDERRLTSIHKGDNATTAIDSAAMLSMLHEMAKRISKLEQRLNRTEPSVWKRKRYPDYIENQLTGGAPPVKVFRRYRGMTQKELAARAGCSTGYISQLEQRVRLGSIKALRRIADILDVDVRELMEPGSRDTN